MNIRVGPIIVSFSIHPLHCLQAETPNNNNISPYAPHVSSSIVIFHLQLAPTSPPTPFLPHTLIITTTCARRCERHITAIFISLTHARGLLFSSLDDCGTQLTSREMIGHAARIIRRWRRFLALPNVVDPDLVPHHGEFRVFL